MNSTTFRERIGRPYIMGELTAQSLNEQGKDGSRSSKRTDAINKSLIQILQTMSGGSAEWSFVPEVGLPCSRGSNFKVDIAAYHKGKLRAVILLKAIVKNYNKNRHNYANTVDGEMGRIFDVADRTGVDAITIDWIPRHVPTGAKMEETSPADMSLAEGRWNSYLGSRGNSVSFCKLRFNYDRRPNGLFPITQMAGHLKLHTTLMRLFK